MRVPTRLALGALSALTPMLLVGLTPAPATAGGQDASQLATTTPIKHFITLMQENHSFDNYFGTYPGADGPPAGTCMPQGGGKDCVAPWHIGNSPIEDLGHNTLTFKLQYDHGKMDGFVTAYSGGELQNATLPMGYYDRTDLPFYWNIADQYVLFDRNFTSAHAGSVANHMYWITGTPGGNSDSIPADGFDVTTIFDELQAEGISWKFYIENYDPTITYRSRGASDRGSQVIWCPLLAYPRFLDDPELNSHIATLDDYYTDLENGTLPAVSYIVPSGSSEHPPGSLAAGEAFVSNIISGLMRSSAWDSSAFMWSYDDWGGWYDHVKPPKVDAYGYGFRAPALLVSPYAKRGYIDHTTIDFTSQLKFIETNWDVPSLAARDSAANGLGSAFDFTAAPRPPQIVSQQIVTPAKPIQGRSVVYASYSGAVGIFLLIMIGVRWSRRGARRVAT